ncbi:MAG: hypothetical protein H7Z72_13495 [Bacteroidetes bacterium]|nr:hypothetical protein [Fibrella sp.]
MKKALFALWLPLSLLACSTKNDVPRPDAATVISGEYQLNRTASFSNDQPGYDIILPQKVGNNTRTGTLMVTRNAASVVSVSLVQRINGTAGNTTTFGKMDVKAAGSGYALSRYDSDKQQTGTGTADGTAITIEFSDTYSPTMTTTRYVLEAKR